METNKRLEDIVKDINEDIRKQTGTDDFNLFYDDDGYNREIEFLSERIWSTHDKIKILDLDKFLRDEINTRINLLKKINL